MAPALVASVLRVRHSYCQCPWFGVGSGPGYDSQHQSRARSRPARDMVNPTVRIRTRTHPRNEPCSRILVLARCRTPGVTSQTAYDSTLGTLRRMESDTDAADRPFLKATGSSGREYLDPSEDLLFELIADVEQGDEEYFIVERATDATAQTYIQTMRGEDGRWVVEHRAGGPTMHFKTSFEKSVEAHAVITAWCFGNDPVLLDKTPWVPLSF